MKAEKTALITELEKPLYTLTIGQMQSLIRGCIDEALKGIEPKAQETERYYTRKEACDLLKISMPTLAKYLSIGIVGGHKIGNRILISEKDIDDALVNK